MNKILKNLNTSSPSRMIYLQKCQKKYNLKKKKI